MSVEDRLREAMHDDSYALQAWPDAAARVRAGMSRRRRRRAVVAAAAVAAIAVLTAPVAARLAGDRPVTLGEPVVIMTPTRGQVIAWQEHPVSTTPAFGSTTSTTLLAHIDVASTVDPGTDLEYIVSLENRSDEDLSLVPCPVFVQRLGTDGGSYLLNCTFTRLPAHSWVRLQMRLLVSADASAGMQTLSWTTEIGDQTAMTSANITVR
jgi:hypothetical protein